MHKFSKTAICISIFLSSGLGNAATTPRDAQGDQTSKGSEVNKYESFKLELEILNKKKASVETDLIKAKMNKQDEVFKNQGLLDKQLQMKQRLERMALDKEFANQNESNDIYLAKKKQLTTNQLLEYKKFEQEQAINKSSAFDKEDIQYNNFKNEFKDSLKNLYKSYGYVEGEFNGPQEYTIINNQNDKKPVVKTDYNSDQNNSNNSAPSNDTSLNEDQNIEKSTLNNDNVNKKTTSHCNTELHLSLFTGEFWCTTDPYPCGGYYSGLKMTDFTRTTNESCLTEESIRPGGVYAVNNESNEKIYTITEDISESNCMTELHSVNVTDIRGSVVANYQFTRSINKCPPPANNLDGKRKINKSGSSSIVSN